MKPHSPDDDFDGLLLAMSSGQMDESKRVALEKQLKEDPTARCRYLDYIGVDAMLRWRFDGVIVKAVREPERVFVRSWFMRAGMAAAALLVLGLSCVLLFLQKLNAEKVARIPVPQVSRPNLPDTVAVIPPTASGPDGRDEGAAPGATVDPGQLGGGSAGRGPLAGALPPKELSTGVEVVTFSPDGKYLAGIYRETETITVYDSKDRSKIVSVKVDVSGGEAEPFMVFSHDSKRLAFIGCYRIKVFNLPSGELYKDLGADNYERNAGSAVFSADDRQLVTCHGNRVLFWDIDSAKLLKQIVLDDDKVGRYAARTSVILDAGRVLAISDVNVGMEPEKTVVWDPAEKRVLQTLKGNHVFISNDQKLVGTIRSVDGSSVRYTAASKTVSVWDILSGKELFSMKLDDEETAVRNVSMTVFALSSDNQSILFFKKPNDLIAIRLADGKEVFRKHFEMAEDGYPHFIHDIHCSPAKNGLVAVGMRFNKLELVDFK